MNKTVEISDWIDNFLDRWDKNFNEPLSDSERQNKRKFYSAWANALSKVERGKLSDLERRWTEWLQAEVTKIAEAETVVPHPYEENPPDWFVKVRMELVEAYAPTIKFKNLLQKRSGQSMALTFGEFIGHHCSAWNQNSPGMAASCELVPEPSREGVKKYLEKFRPKVLAAVEEALVLAARQQSQESIQFFRGYSLALQKGTLTETGRLVGETFRTKIFFMFAWFPGWLSMSHINSVREVFEWLKIVLPKGELNDTNGFKRVEKICQDIGLHFGPPGRPRGS